MWKTIQSIRAADGLGLVAPEHLAQSYDRCRLLDVSEHQERIRDTLLDGEVKNFLQQHGRLLTYARLVIEEYMNDLKGAHNLFLLTHTDGRILGLWSHPEIVSAANHFGLRPGASLAENSAGTNAVAVALATQSPIALSGPQHLCRIFNLKLLSIPKRFPLAFKPFRRNPVAAF